MRFGLGLGLTAGRKRLPPGQAFLRAAGIGAANFLAQTAANLNAAGAAAASFIGVGPGSTIAIAGSAVASFIAQQATSFAMAGVGAAAFSSSAAIAGTTFWVVEGDSRSHSTTFVTAPADLYFHKVQAAEPFITAQNVQAVDGSSLTLLIGRAATVDGLKTSNPLFANYVLSVWIGVNDATGTQDYVGNPSGFLTALASYCDARRAAGWKVVICTELPAYTGADATTYSSWRATVNAAIGGWLGTHADAIADLGANPTIGPDGSQLGANWAVDNLHPNTGGHSIIAPIVRAAIQRAASTADVDPVLSAQTIWDSGKMSANCTLTGSSRIATMTASGINPVMSVNTHVRGRRHAEVQFGGANNNNVVGPEIPTMSAYTAYAGGTTSLPGAGFAWVGVQIASAGVALPWTTVNAMSTVNFGPGNTFMMEINFDLGYVWTGRNGVWDTNDPALLTNPNYTFPPYTRWYLSAASVTSANSYTVPATPSFMSSGASPF